MSSSSPKSRGSLGLKLLLALVTSTLMLGAMEGLFRLNRDRFEWNAGEARRFREYVVESRSGAFIGRPYIGFSRPIGGKQNNALGLRGEEWAMEREADVLRILCLGGSTTEGGNNGGVEGSYPYQLEQILEEWYGRDFEVLNGGVSGWTTMETMVAYFTLYQDYKPDLVILHHAVNDAEPRNQKGFMRDYSHWRKTWEMERFGGLHRWLVANSDLYTWKMMERGVPDIGDLTTRKSQGRVFDGEKFPPETAMPFERNVITIAEHVTAHAGEFMLVTLPFDPESERSGSHAVHRTGIVDHNRILRELTPGLGCMLVDLDALARRRPDWIEKEFEDLVHVTPAGNQMKAAVIARHLIDNWEPLSDLESASREPLPDQD